MPAKKDLSVFQMRAPLIIEFSPDKYSFRNLPLKEVKVEVRVRIMELEKHKMLQQSRSLKKKRIYHFDNEELVYLSKSSSKLI